VNFVETGLNSTVSVVPHVEKKVLKPVTLGGQLQSHAIVLLGQITEYVGKPVKVKFVAYNELMM
jgi:hypothetical protein